jgi:hypothetical protein
MLESLTTPIAFIIFNRPETTTKVFEKISQIKPQQLLVIADGPRSHYPQDIERCRETRNIIDRVDWDCEVIKNYAEVNLGCAKRIETGLNWVFTLTDSAIILEDDCLPHSTFFAFCQELLNKYRSEERVMHIGGHNRLYQWRLDQQSYHFSYLYGSPHGWATWRRAWSCYNQDNSSWNNPQNLAYLAQVITDSEECDRFQKLCDRIFKDPNLLDEWGYKWTFVKLARQGLSIIPASNLVTHIGSGADATHIKHKTLLNGSSLLTEPLNFPLVHPTLLEVDLEFEREHGRWSIGEPSAIALQPLIKKLLATGKNINALVLIEKALSQEPDSVMLNYQKAKALLALKQPKRALPILARLRKMSMQTLP